MPCCWKGTMGLMECNSSLPPGLWLHNLHKYRLCSDDVISVVCLKMTILSTPLSLCTKYGNSFPLLLLHHHHNTTTVLRPFFRDHPGEPVPEENFWTLWCNGRLTEAETPTIWLGATTSGLTSAHLHHPPIFYGPDALPAAQPTVGVKALKGTGNTSYNQGRMIYWASSFPYPLSDCW